jgi:quinol monooxygenase YgiN
MPKVAVIAKITAVPGKRDDLIAAMSELLPAVEEEPGTLMYAIHADKGNADAVWFYEVYTDDDALAAHGKSAAMKAVGGKLAGLVGAAPELFMLDIVGGKSVPA